MSPAPTGRPSRGRALVGVVALLATSAVTTAARADAAPAPSLPAATAASPTTPSSPTTGLVTTPPRFPTQGPVTVTAPLALPPSRPVRLRIAALDVDSSLMALGLEADGTLEVPPAGFPAGAYSGGPSPGELGPAVIAGHVDWAGRPGVFSQLRSLRAGASVTVDRADGTVAVFRVSRVEQFAKDAFPTSAVYGDLAHAGLRLITCGGSFDRAAGHYTDNVVVFAELVDARRA